MTVQLTVDFVETPADTFANLDELILSHANEELQTLSAVDAPLTRSDITIEDVELTRYSDSQMGVIATVLLGDV